MLPASARFSKFGVDEDTCRKCRLTAGGLHHGPAIVSDEGVDRGVKHRVNGLFIWSSTDRPADHQPVEAIGYWGEIRRSRF